MNIADLKNKIWHLPNDTQIAIIPSDDDREESQLKMNWDMWSRTRIKDKGQVLILSFPFGKTEIESELEAELERVKEERDELKEGLKIVLEKMQSDLPTDWLEAMTLVNRLLTPKE